MRNLITQFLVGIAFLMAIPSGLHAQFRSSDFINRIFVPYVAEGERVNDTVRYKLVFEPRTHRFDPTGYTIGGVLLDTSSNNPNPNYYYDISNPVRTWAINSPQRWPSTALDVTFMGAMIRWFRGDTVEMEVRNNLPTSTSMNGEPGQGQMTTSHWHGLNVHAQGDGGPHQPIPNDANDPRNPWKPVFPMVDPAQTLWYHSHVMEFTTEQVAMGAAGIIYVEDTMDQATKDLVAALPNEYAINDFPLVIQEKGFVYDTLFVDSSKTVLTATGLKIVEKPGDGEFRAINGVVMGRFPINGSIIRIRLLNGDPRKSYNIGFSTNIDTSDHDARQTFYQIATDGGYMGNIHPMKQFLINPGERGEFLLDLRDSTLDGATELFMSNLSTQAQYYKNGGGPNDIVGLGGDSKNKGGFGNPTTGLAFMRFDVDHFGSIPNPVTKLPDASLFPEYKLDSCVNPRMRTKNLLDSIGLRPVITCDTMMGTITCDTTFTSGQWTIDNSPMDMMKLDDTVCVNTCEQWTVVNQTPVAHPFHIHKVQFQVVQYIDGSSGTPVTYDYPNLPAHMLGYKDVMIVRKNSQFTFQARFDMFGEDEIKPTNGYMYHCHILTHEDFSMMHQFTVVSDSVCQANGLNISNEPLLPQPEFAIFPNPAENIIHLKSSVLTEGKVRISDIMGRLLKEEKVSAFKGIANISVAELPRGLVLVEFISNKKRVTEKIILE
ncbi:MAG: multicopper oxidase domain-containing protein [Bacteroidia bacterium]|nr:multicopper oxidase domain-containing protein [Bacteroidia bacterium]